MRKVFNLKKMREEHPFLTQKGLANMLGLTQTDISRYEANTDLIPFKVLVSLAQVYNLKTLDDFFNDEVKSEIAPISMEDFYQKIGKIKHKVLTIAQKHTVSPDFYVHVIKEMLDICLHKPTILLTGMRFAEKWDFATSLIGYDGTVNQNECATKTVHFMHTEDRPHAVVPDTDILIFADSELLKNCVIIIPKSDSIFYSESETYAVQNLTSKRLERVDLILYIGDKTVAGYVPENADEAFRCLLTPKISSKIHGISRWKVALFNDKRGYAFSHSENTYCYNLMDDFQNNRLHLAIREFLESKIKDSSVQGTESLRLMCSFFSSVSKGCELVEFPTTTDFMLLCSKLANISNEIKLSILEAEKEYAEIVESVYSNCISKEHIEQICKRICAVTYPNDEDLQNHFPCNTGDLDSVKADLASTCFHEIKLQWEKSILSLVEKLLILIDSYKEEMNIYSLLQWLRFGLGMIQKLDFNKNDDMSSAINEQNTMSHLFFSAFPFDIQLGSLQKKCKKEIYDGLNGVTTFARGERAGKARKLSKTLQNSKAQKDFLADTKKTAFANFSTFVFNLLKMDITDEFSKKQPTENDILMVKRNREWHETLLHELTELAELS